MHRRFSSIMKSSGESSSSTAEVDLDVESKASTIVKEETLTPPSLKIKRVDNYYSRWYKGWKYRVRWPIHRDSIFGARLPAI